MFILCGIHIIAHFIRCLPKFCLKVQITVCFLCFCHTLPHSVFTAHCFTVRGCIENMLFVILGSKFTAYHAGVFHSTLLFSVLEYCIFVLRKLRLALLSHPKSTAIAQIAHLSDMSDKCPIFNG